VSWPWLIKKRVLFRSATQVLATPGVLAPGGWVVMGCQPGKAGMVAQVFTAAGCFTTHEEMSQCVVFKLALPTEE